MARGGEEGRVGEAQVCRGRHGFQPRRGRVTGDAAHAKGVLHFCLRGRVEMRNKAMPLLVCHSASDLVLSRRQALQYEVLGQVDVLGCVLAYIGNLCVHSAPCL